MDKYIPEVKSETGHKLTPDTDLKIMFWMIFAVIIPVAITLSAVKIPNNIITHFENDPTPLGYTISLIIFVLPIIFISYWFYKHPKFHIEKKAFKFTVIGIFILGTVLDVFFGYYFFNFPNSGAILGIKIPVYSFSQGWIQDYLPIEEFGFYILGGLFMALLYVWGDLFWFGAYNVANYNGESKKLGQLFRFHWRSFFIGVVLSILAIIYSEFFATPTLERFPGYFLFLLFLAILPCTILFDVAKNFINWRAFSFMNFCLLLVSVIWEASLAAPYGWWRYKDDEMLGIFIGAWSGLPIEAVLVWFAASWGVVLLYETLRIFFYTDRPFMQAFWGTK